jgi:putative two-component system hydrogenase maturation factor HypX/HoxX
MNTLLLCTTFNSLTQTIYARLKDKGYNPKVLYAVDLDKVHLTKPDIILCPFLKSYLPAQIYQNYPTYILHPAPIGDRGAFSLEYALNQKKWGVVWLRAVEELDAGDIYSHDEFKVRDTYKASLYRQEVVCSSLKSLDTLFQNRYQKQILNPLHEPFTQDIRKIDWQRDNTDTIIKKIYQADSFPGVKDEILGVECYLFGVWREAKFRGSPKEILAKRDGAICLGTNDGAIWITHLKKPNGFKLPATYVLKDRLAGIKEDRLPLLFDKSYDSFYETSVEFRDEVAYLCFNFHNGAMSSAQCIRLKYCVDYLKERCKVLVLVGGMDFFSNGIHLNILEDSKKQGEDGWANINAMNDLIKSILFADEIVTVASLARNAGAGGVFMALACDYLIAKEGVVLNPHYKTLGLSGSEYHTYTLPKRVGEKKAEELLDNCLPISVNEAKKIGMIDKVYSPNSYYEELHQFAKNSYDDDFIWDKENFLEENRDKIESFKERELEIMYPQFWDKNSSFHKLRGEFVYKICPTSTPKRFI